MGKANAMIDQEFLLQIEIIYMAKNMERIFFGFQSPLNLQITSPKEVKMEICFPPCGYFYKQKQRKSLALPTVHMHQTNG